MNLRALILSFVASGVVSGAVYAQVLSDSDISAAIAAGQSKRFVSMIVACTAGAGFGADVAAGMAGGIQPTGGFGVNVSRNDGRIAFLAFNAKRLYQTFSIADVPDELRVPTVFVTVEPEPPARQTSSITVASPIERIVLKSKANHEAVAQPSTFSTEPVEWSNLMGGKVTANRATATFSIGDVADLPNGDIDVIVITEAGERRCKINEKERAKLHLEKSK
jgi:hypothetical protein